MINNGASKTTKGAPMSRERRIFVWAIVALVVIDIGVLAPLVYWAHLTQAPAIFIVEILVAVALVIWYERARKRAVNK
jgi:Flp pilus assembly protein TadB